MSASGGGSAAVGWGLCGGSAVVGWGLSRPLAAVAAAAAGATRRSLSRQPPGSCTEIYSACQFPKHPGGKKGGKQGGEGRKEGKHLRAKDFALILGHIGAQAPQEGSPLSESPLGFGPPQTVDA